MWRYRHGEIDIAANWLRQLIVSAMSAVSDLPRGWGGAAVWLQSVWPDCYLAGAWSGDKASAYWGRVRASSSRRDLALKENRFSFAGPVFFRLASAAPWTEPAFRPQDVMSLLL
jgi:hypothetical protein